MARPPGHIAKSNKIIAALPFRRTWPALAIFTMGGILLWSWFANVNRKSFHQQHTPTHPHRVKSTGAHERTRSIPQSRFTLESAHPLGSNPVLPQGIEAYLEMPDDNQAEGMYPIAQDLIGSAEVETLALRYHLTKSELESPRILALLSDLKTAESLNGAKSIVLHAEHDTDAALFLACATSLAKNGGQDSIAAILERLNQLPLDDSGNIPESAGPLIHVLALARAPDLEGFIGQAAEGKWIATSAASRMAAVNALRSYPNIHSTSILARLRDNDESPHIRHLAAEVLARIQAQDSE